MILNEIIIKDEVKKILIEVKDLIEKGEFEFQSTSKNMATFRQLRREYGITYIDFQDEIIDSIKRLDIVDYYQGPDLDDNLERDLIFWKFGITIFEKEIYLKFDIREVNGKKVVLWSYHFPEHPIKYPFK
ncbi:hypothetical protein [Candidatus Cetobacterium colombiensis]|uniref:Type II toxin-antitoxin system MqsR family toxin n=1 Tax=Candidatus Cetobacterium colombiensis TaxID=3073100 RepID=A0ABU4WCW0_9FUSO|nr:hypothetical protein [Candidatus Cetobacterium colombiensis]MDX8337364.1 hypothetical protein [Candidatus Cetobacterium colombiensis]